MSWRNEPENWRRDCSSDNHNNTTWRSEESAGRRPNSSFDGYKSNPPQFHGRFNRNSESRGSRQEGNVNRGASSRDRSVGNDGNRFASRHNEFDRDNRNTEGGQARGGRGGKRGGRPPPGLKGKDIGLYYRELQKNKPGPPPQTVSVDARKVRQISEMLGINEPSVPVRYESRSRPVSKRLTEEKKATCSASISVDRKPIHITQQKATSSASSSFDPSHDFEDNTRLDTFVSEAREEKHKDTWSSSNLTSEIKMESDDWWAEVLNEGGMSLAASCSGPNDATKRGNVGGKVTEDQPQFQRRRAKRTLEPSPPALDHNSPNIKHEPAAAAVANVQQTAADKYSHVKESVFKRKFLQNLTGSMELNLVKSLARNRELVRDPVLDVRLRDKLVEKENSSGNYRRMRAVREKLPAYQKRQEILDLINQNQVVVISGETGCGKTTQVGQFILDHFILREKGSLCHVVCTQPRRISATSVAQRVADERDEVLGQGSTGYQIRLDKKLPARKQGTIVFCTTGVMLQWMLSDPGLTSISHLILDEIHERDVTSDFVITLLKDVIPKRPDLKVILMSATLNSEQFSAYYENCPSINIPGFTYPVEVNYLEDALQVTNFEFPKTRQQPKKVWHKYVKNVREDSDPDFENFVMPYVRSLGRDGAYNRRTLESLSNPMSEKINIEFIATLLHHICTSQREGAILVFLPGWSEITKLHCELTNAAHFSSSRYLIIPLHSLMPTTVQRSVFDRPRPGVRKIVIATNIAETSITIDDVVFVIDCGKIKMTNFDVERNISTLKPEWVSLANAKQRRGRAGRVQAGVCYHLFSRGREMTLTSYPLPEMLRTTLEQVVLQIKILQIGRVEPFLQRVMDPPDPRAVGLSLKMLRTLNALDVDENLTPLGYHLAKLPMDPQAGKMILMAAIFSCVDPILSVAAGLNFKDPFLLPLGKEAQVLQKKLELANGCKSDHIVLANAVAQWERARSRGRGLDFCREHFLSVGTLQLLSTMKGQLAGYLQEMQFLASRDPKADQANINSDNVNLLKAIICAGLYPNVAHIKLKERRGKDPLVLLSTPEDGKVQMHLRSVNEKCTRFESSFLLYHLKLRSSGVFLHDTTMILPLPLLFFGEGVKVQMKDGHQTIHVNQHTFFRCKESTANVVKVLRTKLDLILEHKISHPGSIDWNDAAEGGILREIIKLIADEGISV